MKNPFSSFSPAERIAEDQIYERVYAEIASGQMDMAAQARAIEEGGGDDGRVKSAYIRYRVSRVKAEIEMAKAKEAETYISEQNRIREKEASERKKVEQDRKRERAENEYRWSEFAAYSDHITKTSEASGSETPGKAMAIVLLLVAGLFFIIAVSAVVTALF
jgi:hypothetical protein